MAGASKGFNPFQVDAAHLAYTILGAFTVLFGLFSLFIKERLYLGEAPIATVVGIVLGHYVLKLFDPVSWSNEKQATLDYITLEVTRVVIALGVFSVGVELPKVSAPSCDEQTGAHTTGLLKAALAHHVLPPRTGNGVGMARLWPVHLGPSAQVDIQVGAGHLGLSIAHRPYPRPGSRGWYVR